MSINLEEIHAFLLSKSTGKTTIDTKTTVAVHAAVSAFIDKDTQGFSIIRSQLPSRVKKPKNIKKGTKHSKKSSRENS